MKADNNFTHDQSQTKNQFEYLGLYWNDPNLSKIKSSLSEYTKNGNHLFYGLILKRPIRLYKQWIEDDKMIIDGENNNKNVMDKTKKSKKIILDKKSIPNEFQNESELLKYWLQQYRLIKI